MKRIIHSEWIKIRSVRTTWWFVGFAIIVPVLISSLYAMFASEIQPDSLFRAVTGGSIVSFMLLGVLGATSYSAEHAFNTIRPTFSVTPRRGRVVVGKAVVVAVLAVAVQLIVVVGGLEIANLIASGRDLDLDLADLDGLVPAATGLVFFAALFALFGLGIALIVRSTPAAIALLILWPLLVESVIGGLLSLVSADTVAEWLPYGAGTTVYELQPDGDPFGRLAGGLVFAAFVVLVIAIGSALTAHRDA
jgi:ABC-2 type transport system permease protein